MNNALQRTLDALDGVRENGKGHAARCPAHDDKSPSLSVGTNAAGAVLLKCHAGCEAEAILDAAGLEWGDLYPDGHRSDGASTRPTPRPQPPQETPKSDPKGIAREKVEAWNSALLDGEQGAQRRARQYLTDQRGIDPELLRRRRVGLRYDKGLWWMVFPLEVEADRVTLRKERGFDPAAMDWKRDDSGKPFMRTKGGGSCLVVMAREDVDGPLLLCAGETDGFSARSKGWNVSFGSAGESTFRGEWARQLAGLEVARRGVVVCYDGDATGRENGPKVARKLAAEGVPVRVAHLPDGKDVNDVLTGEGGPERLRELVEAATPHEATATEPDGTSENESAETDAAPADSAENAESALCTLEWRPFPIEALPMAVNHYVNAQATALNVDPAMIAVPSLPVLAAAVGNTRRVQLKNLWYEPGTVWTAIVGRSGSLKSPSLDAALRPTYDLQGDLTEQFKEERARYETLADEGKEEEEEPTRERLRVGDTTVESVMLVHAENERGLLLARDELGGWLGGFNAYKSGESDTQSWIETYEARPVVIDRKSSNTPVLNITRPAVSVVGGIQPSVLRKKMGEEHFASGFAARLMLVEPPERKRRWTEADVDEPTSEAYHRLVRRLYGLSYEGEPRTLQLTRAAKKRFAAFVNSNAELQEQLPDGPLRSLLSKVEALAARIALTLEVAANPDASEISEAIMRNAIQLAEWFRYEAARLYQRYDFGRKAQSRDERLTANLPEAFGWQAVADLWEVKRRAAFNILDRLEHEQLIEKTGHGEYRKCTMHSLHSLHFAAFRDAESAQSA